MKPARIIYIFILVAFSLFIPHLSYADLSGIWIMTAEYVRPNGTTGRSTNKLTMFQNDAEIVADHIATSNGNIKGRVFGRVVRATSGTDTTREPLELVQFQRVDLGGGNYKAIVIGSVSRDEKTIDGFFVDVNGVKGVMVMKRQ